MGWWLIAMIVCIWMIYCHLQNWEILMDYSGAKERAKEKGYTLSAITGNMALLTAAFYLVLAVLCLYRFIKPFLS